MLYSNLNYNPMEYMKPGIIIIIMIHSELHNHFSLINVTALLSFLKAAGSSINLTVHMNSLGNNNFLVMLHIHIFIPFGTHRQSTQLKRIHESIARMEM